MAYIKDSTPEDVWREGRLPKTPMPSAPIIKCIKDKDTYIVAQQGDFISLDRANAINLLKGLAEFLNVKLPKI